MHVDSDRTRAREFWYYEKKSNCDKLNLEDTIEADLG